MNELIKVVQLPVIEEQLRSMKETVDKRVGEALSLVCTEETVQTVKGVRAELNKEFQTLEEQRKEVEMDLERAIQKGRRCGISDEDIRSIFEIILEG